MSDTVDALLPLSILEAVRNVDTPEGDYDAEYVQELRNKRLGLSDTVYTQIKRYTEAARRGQRPSFDEAVALAKLIGRRPDAETVLRAAGRYIARESYLTISGGMRRMIHFLPSLLARPLAFRRARRIADRYLDGQVTRVGSHLLLIVPRSVTIGTAPGETGCVYYEAGFKELLDGARLSLAKTYLDERRLSVTEIAFVLGFADTSAFSRAFKRWTAVAPREYAAKKN